MVPWFASAWALDDVRDREWTGNPGDRLASAVASAADYDGDGFDDLALGARDASATGDSAGVVSVTLGGATGLAQSPVLVVHGGWAADQLGAGVDAGNVDGGGYPDLVILSGRSAGEICIYPGGPTGLPPLPTSCVGGERFPVGFETDDDGVLLSVVGDVDGDHLDDVVVRPRDPVEDGEGWVYAYVLYGARSGFDPDRETSLRPATFQYAEGGLAGGDLDGDGLSDVVVGSSHGDTVDVFLGTSDGPDPEPITFGSDGSFGTAVSVVGDLDADGYADLAVGAPSGGFVQLFRGTADGPVPSLALEPFTFSDVGTSVDGAGDVDGDGHADLVVGAPGGDGAYLWSGTPAMVDDDAWVVLGGTEGWGELVGGAGDVDGDGFGDLLVVDPGARDEAGVVGLYLGGEAPTCKPERCNGRDDDCDGAVDEDVADAPRWAPDSDGDGVPGGGFVVTACDPPDGYVEAADVADCDDANPGPCVGAPPVETGGCSTGPRPVTGLALILLVVRRRR